MTGAPDAGDPAFWDALGIPPELRSGITESAGVTDVWPETAAAFDLFTAMQTQWRTGMGGPTGLDYAALPAVMDLRCIPAQERPELFDQLRVMEGEALAEFGRRRG